MIVSFGLLAVLDNQPVQIFLRFLYFRAGLVVLVLLVDVYQGVAPVDRVLYLHKVGLPVSDLLDVGCQALDLLDLERVGVPVVGLEGVDELPALLLVRLDGVEVLLEVAGDNVEVVGVERLGRGTGTSMGSMSRIWFSMEGKLKL